jgi:hypothetical protein
MFVDVLEPNGIAAHRMLNEARAIQSLCCVKHLTLDAILGPPETSKHTTLLGSNGVERSHD